MQCIRTYRRKPPWPFDGEQTKRRRMMKAGGASCTMGKFVMILLSILLCIGAYRVTAFIHPPPPGGVIGGAKNTHNDNQASRIQKSTTHNNGFIVGGPRHARPLPLDWRIGPSSFSLSSPPAPIKAPSQDAAVASSSSTTEVNRHDKSEREKTEDQPPTVGAATPSSFSMSKAVLLAPFAFEGKSLVTLLFDDHRLVPQSIALSLSLLTFFSYSSHTHTLSVQ